MYIKYRISMLLRACSLPCCLLHHLENIELSVRVIGRGQLTCMKISRLVTYKKDAIRDMSSYSYDI